MSRARSASGASRCPRERGIAILAVLWGSALLVALVLGAVALVRSQVAAVNVSTGGAQARALAEAGIQRGIAELTLVRAPELWSADGTVHDLNLADGRVEVSIQDISGLIDINTAREELVRELLDVVGAENERGSELTDAILDWRDVDNVRRPGGAEDGDYEHAAYPYGAKDGPFDSVEELRQVMGMNAELYNRISPWVTVYSGATGVNPRFAPEAVLRSLPGVGGVDAARSYMKTRSALPAGSPATPVPGMDPQYLSPIAGTVYRVDASAVSASGARATVSATIRLASAADHPYTVLSWRE